MSSFQLSRSIIPPFYTFCKENNISLNTMSNYDIIRVAKELKIPHFRGCFMRDTLPKHINTNECGIVNLEPDSEQGSHWVSYYKHASEKYYCDSYGLPPTNEMLKNLKPSSVSSQVIMSTFVIQQLGTVICGQLSIYVLYMLTHKS